MSISIETAAATVDGRWTRGRTTIVLESNGEEWHATQRGVDVTGRGETAALAAADYCRRVETDDE